MGDRQFEPQPELAKYVRLYFWVFAVSAANFLMFAVFPAALEKFISSRYQLTPPFSSVPSINEYKNGTRIVGFEAFFCLIYVQFFITLFALVVLLLRRIISTVFPRLMWTVEKPSAFWMTLLLFAGLSYMGPLNSRRAVRSTSTHKQNASDHLWLLHRILVALDFGDVRRFAS